MKKNKSIHTTVMQLFYWIPNTEDMAFFSRADLSILSQKNKIYKYPNTYLQYVL